MKKALNNAAAFVIGSSLLISACSDSGSILSINRPPTITSSATADTPENTAGVVYTAIASDPDGDRVTFNILDGADGSAFSIDTITGEVTFSTPPNFEAAADANTDNIYEVNIQAMDGLGATDSQLVSITITDIDETPGGVRYQDVVFDAATTQLGIQFGEGLVNGGTTPLLMDVYTPFGDTETNRPVIILSFGGSFVGGDRTQLALIAENFATRGYVAATIDYRLRDTDPVAATDIGVAIFRSTHDLYAAVRHFREDGLGGKHVWRQPRYDHRRWGLSWGDYVTHRGGL
ncbi:MAG: cadherin domain-containing protein [Pseudomonadota bacterium]